MKYFKPALLACVFVLLPALSWIYVNGITLSKEEGTYRGIEIGATKPEVFDQIGERATLGISLYYEDANAFSRISAKQLEENWTGTPTKTKEMMLGSDHWGLVRDVDTRTYLLKKRDREI